jgi:hypothetical protein
MLACDKKLTLYFVRSRRRFNHEDLWSSRDTAQVCGALPDVWQWSVMPGKRASHLASPVQQSRGLIYNPSRARPHSQCDKVILSIGNPSFLVVMLGWDSASWYSSLKRVCCTESSWVCNTGGIIISKGKPKYSEIKQSHCHSAHHRSCIGYSRMELRPLQWEAGN